MASIGSGVPIKLFTRLMIILLIILCYVISTTCPPLLIPLMDEFFKLNMRQRQWKRAGTIMILCFIFYFYFYFSSSTHCRTVVGLKCRDGVVLGVEKILHSKLVKRGGVNRRIITVDLHAGFVAAGLTADCRQLGNRAREEAAKYRDTFEHGITGQVQSFLLSLLLTVLSSLYHYIISRYITLQEFSERLGLYLHAYTSYSSVRPFGVTAIVGLNDKDGPHLYMFEPSGVYWVLNLTFTLNSVNSLPSLYLSFLLLGLQGLCFRSR